MTTTIQTSPVRADAALTLSGVLASALPHDLHTAQGPTRYTVPAVFSRRPQPREIDLLRGSGVRQELADAGYSHIELSISDRRLLIGNTNLWSSNQAWLTWWERSWPVCPPRRQRNARTGPKSWMPWAWLRNSASSSSVRPPPKSTSTEFSPPHINPKGTL